MNDPDKIEDLVSYRQKDKMSGKKYVAPHVRRGLTTIQLLDLLGFATENLVASIEHDNMPLFDAEGKEILVPKRGPNGQQELEQARGRRRLRPTEISPKARETIEKYLNMKLPGKENSTKFRETMAPVADKDTKQFKKGRVPWFNPAVGNAAPFRAITPEGRAIEAKRSAILASLRSPGMQPFWTNPAMFAVKPVGKNKGDSSTGSRLEGILTSSYSHGSKKTGLTIQDRVQAITAVMSPQYTTASEPDPPVATGVGGRREASAAQANMNLTGTSGFLNLKVAKALSDLISDRRLSSTTSRPLSDIERAARSRVSDALRAIVMVPAGTGIEAARQALANEINKRGVHAIYTDLVNNVGGADTVYKALGQSTLVNLLTGQMVNKPKRKTADGEEKSGWVFNAAAAASQNPEDPAGYTKFIFDTMHRAYVASGGQQVLNNEAQKLSDKRAERKARGEDKPKGTYGPDHPLLAKEGALTRVNAANVGKFLRDAHKGRFTTAALLLAAQKLGVTVDASVRLPSIIAGVIADAMLTHYGLEIDKAYASGGIQAVNPKHLVAAGSALNIKGFSNIKDTPAAKAEARDMIIGVVNSHYGVLTTDCNKLHKEDIRRILTKSGTVAATGARKSQLCAALATSGKAGNSAPNAISGTRTERTVAYVESSKKKTAERKKAAAMAVTGEQDLLMRMLGGAGVPAAAPMGYISPTRGQTTLAQSQAVAVAQERASALARRQAELQQQLNQVAAQTAQANAQVAQAQTAPAYLQGNQGGGLVQNAIGNDFLNQMTQFGGGQ